MIYSKTEVSAKAECIYRNDFNIYGFLKSYSGRADP